MLEFNKLTLDDIDVIAPFLSFSKNMICDNTIGAAFMWRDYFKVEYALFNDTLIFKAILKYHNNAIAFSPPLGSDVMGSYHEIAKYCRSSELPVIFYNATGYDLEVLKEIFGDYKSCYYEAWSDYIYTSADIISLAGRKFNSKRNHINFFKRNFTDYTFEVITKDNVSDVKDFYHQLTLSIGMAETDVFSEDYHKTIEVLENYDAYRAIGGLIRVSGKVIAFSIGEILNRVLFVHVEKADISYRGAYQIINNEFAKHFCTSDVLFVNREEDVGDEGLRTSKKTYHPCGIINKYIVEIDG